MKNIAIFRGSPRKSGNTNSLTDIAVEALEKEGAIVKEFSLYDMNIRPCLACRACQQDWTVVNCAQKDDMAEIFKAVEACDLILLTTPIYSWFCTPPMKAMLDRLVYAMNMYYGEKRGPSLWEGKHLALIVTCGYPPEKGADLFEEAVKRYCKHSKLQYDGMLCERHMGYSVPFMDEDKEARVAEFARKLTYI